MCSLPKKMVNADLVSISCLWEVLKKASGMYNLTMKIPLGAYIETISFKFNLRSNRKSKDIQNISIRNNSLKG